MVPRGKKLVVGKCDISDFFYRFRIPRWMLPYFALPGILADDIGMQYIYGSGVMVYPCLAVLAMGWSHSVFLTQNIHEYFLDTKTTYLHADNRITPTSDLYVDRLRHIVYVDDLILLGTDSKQVLLAQHEYINNANAADLLIKDTKVRWPTADGLDCLGLEVHGDECIVSPRADKLERLRMDTINLLRIGSCTGDSLAQLVGRWTWVMLIVRPALACFNSVYRFIKCAGRKLFRIWPSVSNELWMIARLSPLFMVHMSSTTFPETFATDASMSGQGIVSASISPTLVELAARSSGIVTPKNDNDTVIDDQLLNHKWKTLVAAPWKYGEEHINQLEIISIATGVRRLLSTPYSIRRRVLFLSDSQVAVAILSKGRTSSYKLLRRVRSISALLLASGIQLFLRWIPSLKNPADGPSRLYEHKQ